jgi:hypothetical protein
MKKRIFTAFAAAAVLFLLSVSCQKNANLSAKEKTLSLEAPSGRRVASSMQQLKSDAVPTLIAKYGTAEQFEITGIQYLAITKGFAAIVSYRLENGTTGNYGIFSGVKVVLPKAHELTVTKDRLSASTQMREADGKVTISCKGTCTCRMSATINADTGVITVDCGCSDCSSTVTSS